jgi:serpin B
MKRNAILLLVAGFLAAVSCGSVWGAAKEGASPSPAPSQDASRAAFDAKAVAAANNAFAADLYSKLAAKEGNLFFSPNSIETALAMTYAGARGKTADQMAAVLHLTAGDEKVHTAFGAFMKDLNAEKGPDGKPRGYQLSVANALWGQDGYGFLPEFLKTVKTNYGAGLSEVDFVKDTEGARKTINTWVEKETRDKIKDLIPEGVLDASTRLVLTNAIYFKGDWAEKFKKEDTKDKPFHLGGGKDVKAPMMNATKHYPYLDTADFQAVKLPYKGNELSMVVVLPKKVDGLANLEKQIAPKMLSETLASWKQGGRFRSEEVVLTLPKFKMTREFGLGDVLAAMGMKDAFSASAADFSGMDGQKDLFISAVVHKAFVDVNEEGTEAAAATAVGVALSSMPAEPITFKADHPFLFLIRHEASGAILFMGRVADPTK